MDRQSIGDRVRQLRKAAGLSREALAEGAGMSYEMVRDLEQGRNMPKFDTACAVARALGVGVEELAKPALAKAPLKVGRPRKK